MDISNHMYFNFLVSYSVLCWNMNSSAPLLSSIFFAVLIFLSASVYFCDFPHLTFYYFQCVPVALAWQSAKHYTAFCSFTPFPVGWGENQN